MLINHARSRRLAAVAVGGLTATLALGGLAVADPNGPGSPDEHGGARRVQGYQGDEIAQQLKKSRAKNVILLIGDGMGDSEITAARDYEYGAGGRLPGIDALPMTGQYTTYSLKKGTKQTDYVPDSAATGSAWATGTKTYDNAVSVDTYGTPQASLLELAKANGLKTGNVTTSEIQDATPAVQASHISARSCYGPVKTSTTCADEALENGGIGSITEQILATRADVTLGGGLATFGEKAKAGLYRDQTLLEQAEKRGYAVVGDKAGLDAVRSADQDAPLLGLFADGNLPTRWKEIPAVKGGATAAAQPCQDNPARPANQPTLADMTDKAIDLLKNKDGFFLQVEGASIDKRDHSADACGQIGETIDLDEAVQKALAFAKADGNTSVFVTADHAHTSQIVDGDTPGLSVNLRTTEGSDLKISYGTAPSGGSQQHTGSQLRIAGYGPRSANVVGLSDQTDLFFTIRDALGLKTVANPTTAPVIAEQPASVSVADGGAATFSVAADESIATFQWQVKKPGAGEFTDLVGERGDVLVVPSVGATDDGSQYRVVVTNKVGSTTSQAATLDVTLENDGRLAASSVPVVTGTPKVGARLSATAGVWNKPDLTFGYQWLRGGKAIAGATKATYTVAPADAGRQLSVRVTAAKPGFTSGSSVSAPTATVSRLKPTVSVKATTTRAVVRISRQGLPADQVGGRVSVFDGTKVLARDKAVSAKGSVTVGYGRLAKGTHRLKVVYSGSTALSGATTSVTVKR